MKSLISLVAILAMIVGLAACAGCTSTVLHYDENGNIIRKEEVTNFARAMDGTNAKSQMILVDGTYIGTEISAIENTLFYERTNSGDFDICMCHPWTTAMAYMTWRGGYSTYDNYGPGFGVNDKFPGYLETILTSIDEDEIYATFDQIWADIYAAYPATPLYAGMSSYVHTDEVSGFIWTRGTQNLIDFSEVVINRK